MAETGVKVADLVAGGTLDGTELIYAVKGGVDVKTTPAEIIVLAKADTSVADAISKKHTQGTDTTLGAMTANVNMNSHKLAGLSVPSANGESIRATTKITEVNLESAIDLKHEQGSDIQDLSGLVVKEAGKSLISDIEITRLAGITNQTLGGLGGEAIANKKTDIDSNKTSDIFYASIKAIYDWGVGLFVQKNIAITSATKTKVTYDSKGLVTSGADATTADIVSSTDKRYLTDAQLASLHPQETNASIDALINAATAQGATIPSDTDKIILGKTSTFNSILWSNFKAWFITSAQLVSQTIGDTTHRLTKLWATDIESTNMPTVGGVSLNDIFGGSGGWAGVRWNPALPGTAMTRVGDANWEQLFEDCSCVALNDDGTINTVLATYAAPTITGATDGSIGQVMTRIPRKYYREIFNSNNELCGLDMSNLPIAGFKLHEKFSWGNGRSEIYIGSAEGSTASSKYQSIYGVALDLSKTMREFNDLAVARGTGWHGYDYYTHHLLQMMFYIYYANLNSQLVLPAYSEHTWTDGSPKRNAGRTIGLTTMNGYVNADEAGVDADLAGGWNNTSRVIANRFLWVENLYGHVWKFLDGCSFDGRVGKRNTAYLTPNPLLFSSVDANILTKYINMNVDLPAAGNESWQQSLGSLMLPKTFGGDSATYVTDYFWSYLDDASRDHLRVVVAGGPLSDGVLYGVAARYSVEGLNLAASSFVSRLCFENN